MIPHPTDYALLLSQDGVETVITGAFRILDEAGLVIQSEEACERFAEVGARWDRESMRVRIAPELAREHVRNAPSKWVLHARNPERNVTVGARSLALAPGYGSAFVADARGDRRTATLEDFRRFARLAGRSDAIDITGGLLVEPADVAPEDRPAVLTRTLLECSDKPLFGSVAGADGAGRSLDVAREVLGDIEARPSVLGLININSPLRLDARMAEAMLIYVRAGQPIVLTPGILMGITAPVTLAGAMAQAWAELLGCVTLAQVIRPGAPVIVGTGGFAADLRAGGSGFGRPEQAVSTLVAAQIARHFSLPYRCSPGVTGAMGVDVRAGYESMMTALAGWQAGAHLGLQAAGTLDCINTMSLAKFRVDLEIWGYVKHMARGVRMDTDALALDDVLAGPADHLSLPHTVEHFREACFMPTLAPAMSHDSWLEAGCPDAVDRAMEIVEEWLSETDAPGQ
ncbi:MAG: trimethylamine methyltransferase family protein [Phycisphaerae bacterium]|nr:trimethylamine methyltransferase family protein [Phycisphaerae bacterium]